MRQDYNIAISLANNLQNIQYVPCLTCPQFFLKISVLNILKKKKVSKSLSQPLYLYYILELTSTI